MPIPFRFDYIIQRLLRQGSTHSPSRILRRAAGVRLPEEEARVVLPAIERHKWFMSEQVGRNVGLRVAAVDFFENIHPDWRPRPLTERLGDLLAGNPANPASLAGLERVFGGQRA